MKKLSAEKKSKRSQSGGLVPSLARGRPPVRKKYSERGITEEGETRRECVGSEEESLQLKEKRTRLPEVDERRSEAIFGNAKEKKSSPEADRTRERSVATSEKEQRRRLTRLKGESVFALDETSQTAFQGETGERKLTRDEGREGRVRAECENLFVGDDKIIRLMIKIPNIRRNPGEEEDQ